MHKATLELYRLFKLCSNTVRTNPRTTPRTSPRTSPPHKPAQGQPKSEVRRQGREPGAPKMQLCCRLLQGFAQYWKGRGAHQQAFGDELRAPKLPGDSPKSRTSPVQAPYKRRTSARTKSFFFFEPVLSRQPGKLNLWMKRLRCLKTIADRKTSPARASVGFPKASSFAAAPRHLQKCGPAPPFHKRQWPGCREFTSKLPQSRHGPFHISG